MPMSEPDNILDVDFDAQMRGLFQQAEREIGQRIPSPPKALPVEDSDVENLAANLLITTETTLRNAVENPAAEPEAEQLQSLSEKLSAITEAISANARALSRMETGAVTIQDLPKLVGDLRALLEMKNGVSHSMFSALHEELKGYKDNFLLQSVYRPIIRDLVSLYDDLIEIHRQVREAIKAGTNDAGAAKAAQFLIERLRTMEMNVEHNIEFIIEVLARLEVSQIPLCEGKLDKIRQRAVAVEAADCAEDDTLVVRCLKRGFLWHDRLLRPEEVVVKKWRGEAASQ